MKRVIVLKGDDGDVRVEVRATVRTNNLARYESEKVVNTLANLLFRAIGTPYARFGVHNVTVNL